MPLCLKCFFFFGFRDRIAAIEVKETEDPTKSTVVFDLIPPLNRSGNKCTVFEISIVQFYLLPFT